MLKRTVLLALLLLTGLAGVSSAVFQQEQLDSKYYINIIVILDCSASMNKIIGPVRKVDIAKRTVETIVNGIAGDSHDMGSMKAGLRVFGSKFYKWKQDCDDTSLEVVLAEIETTRDPILAKTSGVKAKGQSALSLSIDALKQDFPGDEDDQSNFIVVVSDGDESCGASPCDAVRKLVDTSKGVSVSTIGVETTQSGYDNLNCMAEAGNGLYFDSKDVEDFVLFLKDCNQTIQENRRTLALKGDKSDSLTIAMRDVTANLTEYHIDEPTPLYPLRDVRFPADDTLKPDDKLFLIGSRGLWMEIFAPEKQLQGWILTKTGGSEFSVTVAEDQTPLYKDKSPSSQVLVYMEAGEQLTVLKKEGEWYNVVSQKLNQRGWVIAFNVVGN
ncbi:MAG: VWA domain-containing protein [Candidatus Glassbacteria bacterium]|nr:VWA domain-containing protein [Candidatus Glassbacteria bacterium]